MALSDVQLMIDNAWAQVYFASNQTSEMTRAAISEAKEGDLPLEDIGAIASVHSPSYTLGDITTPMAISDVQNDLKDLYDDMSGDDYDALMNDIQTRLDGFLNDHYPDYSSEMQTVINWLDDAIRNGGTGVNQSLERAAYYRDRDRFDREALKQEEEVVSSWAARGFPMPTGSTAKQVQEVRADNAAKAQNRSREIAIETIKLELENVRFAVQQSVALFTGLQKDIANAATNYMGAILGVAKRADGRAGALVDTMRILYDTSYRYAEMELQMEKLKLEAEGLQLDSSRADVDRDLRIAGMHVDNFRDRLKARVDAAIAGAQSMGHYAAAAVGSQNTTAAISSESVE